MSLTIGARRILVQPEVVKWILHDGYKSAMCLQTIPEDLRFEAARIRENGVNRVIEFLVSSVEFTSRAELAWNGNSSMWSVPEWRLTFDREEKK